MLEPYLRAEFVPENLPTPASFLFALSNAGRGCRRRSRHSAAHGRVATQCAHAGTLARAVLSKQFRESRVPSSCPYNPCAQDLLEWCCCSLSSWRPDHRGTTIRSPRLAHEVLPKPPATASREAQCAASASSFALQEYPNVQLPS